MGFGGCGLRGFDRIHHSGQPSNGSNSSWPEWNCYCGYSPKTTPAPAPAPAPAASTSASYNDTCFQVIHKSTVFRYELWSSTVPYIEGFNTVADHCSFTCFRRGCPMSWYCRNSLRRSRQPYWTEVFQNQNLAEESDGGKLALAGR